jgi:hypothetical protein
METFEAKQACVDITRAAGVTPQVAEALRDMFEYHKWTPEQVEKGAKIREALKLAAAVIIDGAPPSPDRSAALRKLREARMDANSAITHGGKY